VVYPEDDIFGDYNRLLYLVLAIAFFGLLLSFVLSSLFTHRKLLPLNMLTRVVQKISQGDYSLTIPNTQRGDEIGQLQDDFQQMQHSLAAKMAELEQMNTQLKERTRELQQANRKAQEADRMKTAFLHQMTNQMLTPAETLNNHVTTLCKNYRTISAEDADQKIEAIHQQGKTIVHLLDDMIHSADNETGKEEANE
jgi:methyl-accepting chemotaxis protein/sigma-B regulation protein RsbU (phosphoserine phosphatase)